MRAAARARSATAESKAGVGARLRAAVPSGLEQMKSFLRRARIGIDVVEAGVHRLILVSPLLAAVVAQDDGPVAHRALLARGDAQRWPCGSTALVAGRLPGWILVVNVQAQQRREALVDIDPGLVFRKRRIAGMLQFDRRLRG